MWIYKSKEYGNLKVISDICDIIVNLERKSDNIVKKNDSIHQRNEALNKSLSIGKKRFPPKKRLEICEYIFGNISRDKLTVSQVVKLIKLTKVYQEWKLDLSHFEPYTDNYIKDLIAIIIKLLKLNQNFNKDYDDHISIHSLSLELYTQGIKLGVSLPQFERILTELFDFLKLNFNNEFKVERVKKGRKIKFDNESVRIATYKKKFRLLFELNNPNHEFKILEFITDPFKGRCAKKECNSDYTKLPAIEFHHLDSSFKNVTWNRIYSKAYNDIKVLLESDKTIPICRNCHEFFSSNLFQDFEDIILKEYLFYNKENQIRSVEEIDNLLDNLIINHPNYIDRVKKLNQTKESIKFQIKGWLKKRAVIEQLFDGKCQGCNEVSIKMNLPALTFHHLNSDEKKSKWTELLPSLTISQLSKGIVEEECTCLCANCHAIIESKYYFNNIAKIFHTKNDKGNFYTDNIESSIRKAEDHFKQLKKNLRSELNRIRNLQKIEIEDYLNERYGYGNAWKRYLIAIYHNIMSKNINKIRPREINLTNVGKYFKKLMEKDLLRLVEEKKGSFRIYELSDKGFIEVEKIFQSWNNEIKIQKERKKKNNLT